MKTLQMKGERNCVSDYRPVTVLRFKNSCTRSCTIDTGHRIDKEMLVEGLSGFRSNLTIKKQHMN